MDTNKVTPIQAVNVLDLATRPENSGKLSRADFVNVEAALHVLAEFVNANTPKPEAEKKKPDKP